MGSKLLLYGLTAYLVGMLIAVASYTDALKYAASGLGNSISPYSSLSTPGVNWVFIIFFIGITLLGAYLIIKLKDKFKGINPFRTASLFYVFMGTFAITWFLTLLLASPNITILGLELILAGSILISLGMVFLYRKYKLLYFNFFAVLVSVTGIYALASLGIATMIVIMSIMAIYDYIAVFKTKHMQKMAMIILAQDLPPVMLIDGSPEDIMKKLNTPQPNPLTDPVTEAQTKKTNALGLGDIILPGALIGAIAISAYSIFAVPLAFAATGGIYLSMVLSNKLKSAIPAIPVIGIVMGAVWLILVIL